MNTATSEMLIDRIVKPISTRALERRFHGRPARLDVTIDVFQHDDGVVDHEADRDRQTHQRKVVQRIAQHIHQREGPEQRQRGWSRWG